MSLKNDLIRESFFRRRSLFKISVLLVLMLDAFLFAENHNQKFRKKLMVLIIFWQINTILEIPGFHTHLTFRSFICATTHHDDVIDDVTEQM